MEQLIKQQFQKIIQLTDKEWSAFLSISIFQEVKAKQNIERSAYVGRRSFFLFKGSFRMFYTDNQGSEITTHFFLEPNFITNCEKFLSQIQENLNIQALESCQMLVFNNDALTGLYDIYPNLKEIEGFVIKSILNETVHHNMLLQIKNPEERYKNMFEQRPVLAQKVSVTYLSSYLGMARETLSRVRSKFV